jgi:CRP/FNR family cyclic AMP-dependent transcriptional regulator
VDYHLLTDFNLFDDVSDTDLKHIYSVTSRQAIKKGNMVLIEEEMGSTLFLIISGKVKISRISDDGREVILSILSEGDFFGEMAIIDGFSRSANVITIEDSDLMMIRKDDFFGLLHKVPTVAINLLKELTARLRRSDQHIKSLSLQDAVGKVASALLRLAENSGMIKNGQVIINNIPAQQDLANMAGTSRETISRAIKVLGKDGFLNKDGNSIIIYDYDRFRAHFS